MLTHLSSLLIKPQSWLHYLVSSLVEWTSCGLGLQRVTSSARKNFRWKMFWLDFRTSHHAVSASNVSSKTSGRLYNCSTNAEVIYRARIRRRAKIERPWVDHPINCTRVNVSFNENKACAASPQSFTGARRSNTSCAPDGRLTGWDESLFCREKTSQSTLQWLSAWLCSVIVVLWGGQFSRSHGIEGSNSCPT